MPPNALCNIIEVWLKNEGFSYLVIEHHDKKCLISGEDRAANRVYIGHIDDQCVVLYDDVDPQKPQGIFNASDPQFFQQLEAGLSFARPDRA